MDSSTYNTYAYHKYMIDNYDYTSKYSYKRIYNGYKLSAISSLLSELQTTGWQGKFGLGICQWTAGRTIMLLNNYKQVAAPADTITLDQCIVAELKTALNELRGDYKSVYTNWVADNSNNLNSSDAAYNAGYTFCYNYEKPSDKGTKSVTRGNLAKNLYNDMMGLQQ